jgi:peptidoglycan hydrolase FlgJ
MQPTAVLSSVLPAKLPPRILSSPSTAGPQRPDAPRTDEVRKHFTQFVGETFYGQMLKSMRATVGKPAYFDGGRAEEVFRGQLDQALAEQMTKASADRFVDPLFERQFPHLTK